MILRDGRAYHKELGASLPAACAGERRNCCSFSCSDHLEQTTGEWRSSTAAAAPVATASLASERLANGVATASVAQQLQ